MGISPKKGEERSIPVETEKPSSEGLAEDE